MESAEIEVPASLDGGHNTEQRKGDDDDTEKIRVWRPKKEGWDEAVGKGSKSYLSVNMTSLDAGQDGLDLREFVDKGWIVYTDYLSGVLSFSSKPSPGGMY
jgi:hypothetical protein